MHYLLFYEVNDDYLARRAEFRDAHLEKAWKSSERGELLLGGALTDPIDGAVLLFRGDSPAVAENFAKSDPYVTSGLVKRWHVREWTTVAGENAAKPVRPSATAAGENTKSRPTIEGNGAFLRMWKTRTTAEKVDEYVLHATETVFPALKSIEGHRGSFLLRRAGENDHIEIVVLTLWESMDAIRRFAGDEPTKAVVEPAARKALSDFDDFVTHFEVVASSR